MSDSIVNPKDYCIVVMSCDSYSDAWPHFAKCWDRFWPDCPFESYLISETKTFHHGKIENIKIGEPACWSDMLLHVLNQLPHKHIIYMQEDYLLKSAIEYDKVEEKLGIYQDQKAVYFRMMPWPNPDKLLEPYTDVGIINNDSGYRTSLQCAVWDKEYLKAILVPGESGWDFECHSIDRSSNSDRPFLSLFNNVSFAELNNGIYPIDYFASGILKGKWMRECLLMFRKKGIIINPGKRGILSRWDYFYYKFKKHRKNLFYELLDKYIFNSFFYRQFIYLSLRLRGEI